MMIIMIIIGVAFDAGHDEQAHEKENIMVVVDASSSKKENCSCWIRMLLPNLMSMILETLNGGSNAFSFGASSAVH